MYCKNCGRELKNETSFCTGCGAARVPLQPPEPVTAAADGAGKKNASSGKIVKPLLVILSVVLLLSVALIGGAVIFINNIFGAGKVQAAEFMQFVSESMTLFESQEQDEPNTSAAQKTQPGAQTTTAQRIMSEQQTQTSQKIKSKQTAENNKYAEDMPITLFLKVGARDGYYTGEIKNGVPHGKGKFTTQNPAGIVWYYEGGFVDSRFEGKGIQEFEDGRRDECSYTNNMKNGKGKYYIDEELVYEGSYKDDARDGYGKLYSNGEVVYEGMYVIGIPEEQPFKDVCLAIEYEDILRLPEYYDGVPIKISGTVVQVIEKKDNEVNFRIATKDGRKEIVYIGYERKEGEPRILEKDVVTTWGICIGLVTYEGSTFNKINIPGMISYYISID